MQPPAVQGPDTIFGYRCARALGQVNELENVCLACEFQRVWKKVRAEEYHQPRKIQLEFNLVHPMNEIGETTEIRVTRAARISRSNVLRLTLSLRRIGVIEQGDL